MKSRRFVFVVLDSTGRPVRRRTVSRRVFSVAAAATASLVVLLAALSIHAIFTRSVAEESHAIRAENEALRQLAEELQAKLPQMRGQAMRAETGFAQLWSKSGVGVEPRMLAVGPVDTDIAGGTLVDMADAAPISGEILELEPVALPLEVERIQNDSEQLQHLLADLLEYFHDAERVLSHTPSIRPTSSIWTTSGFGRRRDPMSHEWLMHKGIDFGGQVGFPIIAPADGVVIFVGRRGGYGNTVVVHHGWGLQTHFAHLSRFRVQEGEIVRRGQLIADMGSTGKSTGPHLHYEVRRWGQPLNPARFVLD